MDSNKKRVLEAIESGVRLLLSTSEGDKISIVKKSYGIYEYKTTDSSDVKIFNQRQVEKIIIELDRIGVLNDSRKIR